MTMYVTNTTPRLKSITIGNGQRVIIKGWDTCLRAESISINSSYTDNDNTPQIQCEAFTDLPGARSNRVWIVADSLTVGPNAVIAAFGYKGYVNGSTKRGSGPGWANGGANDCAGAYGGASSDGRCLSYGSLTEPTDPGTSGYHVYTPAAAGGAMRLEVGTLVVNGRVNANGEEDKDNPTGSGGSVWITCRTLSGTGSINANGGCNTEGYFSNKAMGGGGRIAIYYDKDAQSEVDCQVSIGAIGGYGWESSDKLRYKMSVGRCGTVYLCDDRLIRREGLRLKGCVYYGTPVTRLNSLTGTDLALVNTLLEFSEPGEAVKVSGDLTLSGDVPQANGLRMTAKGAKVSVGGNLKLRGATLRMDDGDDVAVGGDLALADGKSGMSGCGILYVKAAPTNELTLAYGATVKIGGDFDLGSYSVFYPVCNPTNGSIVSVTAGSFSLTNTAIVSANSAGWGTKYGPGIGSSYRRGSGHGGRGGTSSDAIGGGYPYGDKRNPMTPGSAAKGEGTAFSGPGGGVVLIETAGGMRIDGTISANGANDSVYTGTASGGTINLKCGFRLSGEGAFLTADGGNATLSANGNVTYGTGAGGRIAIRYAVKDDSVDDWAVHAAGGKAYNQTERTALWGEDGTVYWRQWHQGLMMYVR